MVDTESTMLVRIQQEDFSLDEEVDHFVLEGPPLAVGPEDDRPGQQADRSAGSQEQQQGPAPLRGARPGRS